MGISGRHGYENFGPRSVAPNFGVHYSVCGERHTLILRDELDLAGRGIWRS